MILRPFLPKRPIPLWSRLASCGLALLFPVLLRAAALPEPILPQGVGVNIHFARGHEADLDLIAAAGFKFIRMDFAWEAIERVKGEYNWTEYDELTANLEKRGLRSIYILDYSHGLYERGDSPHHPGSVAAFARWAGAAALRFKDHAILWEIWNEPNGGFWKPQPDVDQYIALAKATCVAIRETHPQATIIAPASSEFPWPFLEKVCASGLLEQLDAVSVHPYRDYRRPPETAAADYQRLRSLIERYASPARKQLPILSGEWGYSTHNRGLNLETQAAWCVRQQLANLLAGVPLSIWYDWKDDGTDAGEVEHHFGTVSPDLRPKPSYEALKVMNQQLDGCRVARRLEVGNPSAYVLLLRDQVGRQKLAAWSLSGALSVSVDIGLDSPADLVLVNGKGETQTAGLRDRTLSLALTPLPQYVTLKKPSRALAAAAAWRVEPLTGQSVRAGVRDGLGVRFMVTNPFPHSIKAEVVAEGPGLKENWSQVLPANGSAAKVFAGTLTRRDLAQVSVSLTIRIREEPGALLGTWPDVLAFSVANPLKLLLAPTEHGVRAIVENESGEAFAGTVESGADRQPLALAAGQKSAGVDLSLQHAGAEIPGLRGRLTCDGALVAETQVGRMQLPHSAHYYQAAMDGDAKVPGTCAVRESAPPAGWSPAAGVFALDYRFDAGWRFCRCAPDQTVVFEAHPKAYGLWVSGDHSGNFLRLRVRDNSGQTFQVDGPHLDWSGWRWVVFDLSDLAACGRWGGANDGIVKGNLTLETALLLDGEGRKTEGKIFFTDPAISY